MATTLKTILLPLLFIALPAGAGEYPARPQGPVADFAGVFDATAVASLSRLSQSLWEQAGFALVIATVPSIGDATIEGYATGLYETWGIGAKGRDEGALIVLSLEPRRVKIEVGYGAEGYLNDAKAGRLLDTYGVPYFKSGDYSRGMLAVTTAIAQIVASEKQISLTLPADNYRNRVREATPRASPLSILFFLIIFIVLMSTRFGRALLFWMVLSSLMGGRRGGLGGGFGGGFGGSGFGGGFGGGMSGGGGASRSF
jgi:uncharacterized protein